MSNTFSEWNAPMVTIAAAAKQITLAVGTPADEALTLATTYAIKLGVKTRNQEGGQDSDVEISQQAANNIVEAALVAAGL